MFEGERQPDLFGEQAGPQPYRPDPDKVRSRLYRILAELRAAETLKPSHASLFRTIFPRMSLLLPEEEGAQLRFEFDSEMERLDAA